MIPVAATALTGVGAGAAFGAIIPFNAGSSRLVGIAAAASWICSFDSANSNV